jgi:hypothetical protein
MEGWLPTAQLTVNRAHNGHSSRISISRASNFSLVILQAVAGTGDILYLWTEQKIVVNSGLNTYKYILRVQFNLH